MSEFIEQVAALRAAVEKINISLNNKDEIKALVEVTSDFYTLAGQLVDARDRAAAIEERAKLAEDRLAERDEKIFRLQAENNALKSWFPPPSAASSLSIPPFAASSSARTPSLALSSSSSSSSTPSLALSFAAGPAPAPGQKRGAIEVLMGHDSKRSKTVYKDCQIVPAALLQGIIKDEVAEDVGEATNKHPLLTAKVIQCFRGQEKKKNWGRWNDCVSGEDYGHALASGRKSRYRKDGTDGVWEMLDGERMGPCPRCETNKYDCFFGVKDEKGDVFLVHYERNR